MAGCENLCNDEKSSPDIKISDAEPMRSSTCGDVCEYNCLNDRARAPTGPVYAIVHYVLLRSNPSGNPRNVVEVKH